MTKILKLGKRVVCLTMVMLLMIACLPLSAFAAKPNIVIVNSSVNGSGKGSNVIITKDEPEEPKAQVADDAVDYVATASEEVEEVATLAELQAALASDSTAPVVITATIEIPEGETVTIDLNGKTVTSVYQTGSDSKHIYPLNVYGNLTIKDTKDNGSIAGRGIFVQAGSKLTIESGAIYAIDSNGGSALWMYGGDVVINGGHIEQKAEGTYNFAINGLGGTVTVNGGWVGGNHGAIATEAADVVINDGELVCTGTVGMTDNVLYTYGSGSITINGGSFTADNDGPAGGCCVYDANGGATIKGGTFGNSSGGDVWGTTGTTIKGGTFENLIETKHVAVGATIVNGGKTYTKSESGEMVEATKVNVKTLDELLEALASDSTLPIVITETIVIPEGKTVVLDLNGKTINAGYAEGSTTNHIYVFENYGTLTIKDSSANAKSVIGGVINTRGIFNYGALTLESGTINAIDCNGGYGVRNYAGTFTMNGGTIATTYEDGDVPGEGYDASPVRVDEGATFVMNGGTINNVSNYTVAVDNYGTTTINSGKFTSVHTTLANSGTMIINGGEFTCNGLEGITAHALWAAAGTTTINGGTFNGKDNYNGFNVDASEGATVEIKGGNFLPVHSGSLYGGGTITVSGGTFFDEVPAERLAEGCVIKEKDGSYTVVCLKGSGTAEDPYVINNAKELFFFAEKVNDGTYKNVYVVLGCDIDLEQEDWISIGTSTNPFIGTFDGQGHTISNIWSYERGLFGFTSTGNYVDSGLNGRATIKNLNLKNVTVINQTTSAVGGVVGQANQNTEIDTVTLTGEIQIFGYGYVGGIVGKGYVHVNNCHIEGAFSEDCKINAAYWAVGGIVGHAGSEGGSSIKNCSVNNVTIYSAIYGAGAIAGVGTNGPIENVSAESVKVNAQSTPSANGLLVGCNYNKITGDSTAKNMTFTVAGVEIEAAQDMAAKVGDTYYASFENAVAATKAGETITLLADIEASEVILIGKSITINGNGHKVTSTATRVFRVTTSNVEVTLNNVNMVSEAIRVGTNDIRGISIDSVDNVKLTLNNCSVDFTDASANDWAYAVNVTGGSNHILTIDNGTYEGANVINVRGESNTVVVKNATLTSMYPNNDVYYGACIYVVQDTTSSVEATGNTFNGANTVVINAGYTPVTESNNTDNTTRCVAKIGTTYYTSLAAAIEAAQNGDTIKLLIDFEIDSETYTVADGKSITLDMNGKKITVTDNKTGNYELFYIYGDLTVTGNGTIELTATNNRAWNASSSIFHNRGGVLTIENGTFTHNGGTDMAFVIDNSGNWYGDATTTIEDGYFKSSYIAIRNRMEQNEHGASGKATLNISGGTIEGVSRAIWAQAASTSATAPATGAINISGGTIGLIDTARSAGAVSMTTIFGGTVSSFKGEVGELTVKAGGSITGEVTILTADGETADYAINANGQYVTAVAKIGEIGYATLAEAFAAAQAGDTITLLADIETSATITINKNLTIDGNYKTITYTGTDRAVQITGGTVVINDLTVTMTNAPEGSRGINLYNGVTNATIDVTLNNVTVNGGKAYAVNIGGGKDNKLTINGSTLTGYAAINVHTSSVNHTIVVDGSTLNGKNHNNDYHFGAVVVDGTNQHSLTITNSTVTNENLDGVTNQYYQVIVGANCTVTVNDGIDVAVRNVYNKNGGLYYIGLASAIANAKDGDTIILLADIALSEGITNTKKITLDLNGKTITGTDNATGSFAIITNKGELTITGNGTITLTATNNRGWNAYSSVISNTVGGKLVVENGTIEHLGGTDMAYAIDNLTNGKGTYAETIINGGTIKSTYRAIRQFLNGVEAQNILTINGGTIEGTNKAIWMQDPSKNANTGKLTVDKAAVINGDIYLSVTAGSTEWPVEVSIAASAVTGEVLTSNVPAGYELANVNGTFGVYNGVAKIGTAYYATLANAIAAAQAGDTITLLRDVTLSEGVTVPADKTITLDLNGKAITYESKTQGEAMITNKGTLTINDTVGGGVINYNYIGAADSSYSKGNYTISNAGTLTVNGGKITIANLRGHAKYPIDNNSTTGNAILVINGGHLYNYNTSAIRQFCNSTTYKNSVTINGGLIEGYSAIWVQNPGKNTVNGTLTIAGGEIRTTAAAYVNGTAALKDVASAIYFTVAGEGGAWDEDSLVTITGGVFNENIYLLEEAPTAIVNEKKATINGYIERPSAEVPGTVIDTILGDNATEEEETTVEDAIDNIKNNTALKEKNDAPVQGVAKLEVVLKDMTLANDSKTTITKVVYDVTPKDEKNKEVTEHDPITFRLPIPNNMAGTYVKVYHEKEFVGLFMVQVEGSNKYVEITSDDFSAFTVETTNEAPVAKIGEVGFTSLAAALAAAKSGDTIVLLAAENDEFKNSTVVLNEGITLDLNGHTLEAKYFVAFNGNHIVDSTNGQGLLKVDKEQIALAIDQTVDNRGSAYAPVYMNEGYVFKSVTMKGVIKRDNGFQVVYIPEFGLDWEKELVQALSDSDLQFVVRICWDNGKSCQDFIFSESLAKKVYAEGKAFGLRVDALADVEDVNVEIILRSDTGFEISAVIQETN